MTGRGGGARPERAADGEGGAHDASCAALRPSQACHSGCHAPEQFQAIMKGDAPWHRAKGSCGEQRGWSGGPGGRVQTLDAAHRRALQAR